MTLDEDHYYIYFLFMALEKPRKLREFFFYIIVL